MGHFGKGPEGGGRGPAKEWTELPGRGRVLWQPVLFYVQGHSAAWAQTGLFLEKKKVLLDMNFVCESLCTTNIFLFDFLIPPVPHSYPHNSQDLLSTHSLVCSLFRPELALVSICIS